MVHSTALGDTQNRSQVLGRAHDKALWGLKKTRPFRFLLLESVVLDWCMVSFCLFQWSFTDQNLAVNARNCAETTKTESDVLETPVILMPEKGGRHSENEGYIS